MSGPKKGDEVILPCPDCERLTVFVVTRITPGFVWLRCLVCDYNVTVLRIKLLKPERGK